MERMWVVEGRWRRRTERLSCGFVRLIGGAGVLRGGFRTGRSESLSEGLGMGLEWRLRGFLGVIAAGSLSFLAGWPTNPEYLGRFEHVTGRT